MIYLPARARRTTQYLHRAAWIVGTIAALLAAATAGMWAAGRITIGGAVLGAGITAVAAAAVLAVGACIRSQAAQASTAALAELAEQRETLTQVVAELGRLRSADRERAQELQDFKGYIVAAINDVRWQGYSSCLMDQQAGRLTVIQPE